MLVTTSLNLFFPVTTSLSQRMKLQIRGHLNPNDFRPFAQMRSVDIRCSRCCPGTEYRKTFLPLTCNCRKLQQNFEAGFELIDTVHMQFGVCHKSKSQTIEVLITSDTTGKPYKSFTIVIYDSRVVQSRKLFRVCCCYIMQ